MTFTKIPFAVLLLMLLSTPLSVFSATMSSDDSTNSNASCARVEGVESIYSAPIVIIGEFHGSNEIPEFFFDVVCNYKKHFRKTTIVIGLELPQEFEEIFRRMNSEPKAATVSAIKNSPFWNEFGDGRHSAAMLKLTLALVTTAYESAGKMDLIAFQRPKIDSTGATLILEHAKQTGAKHLLLLMGNFHARKKSLAGGPLYPPLGANLEVSGRKVLSLDIHPGGGEAWVCMPDCGRRTLRTDESISATGIILIPGFRDGAYDGYYKLPRLTVSSQVGSPGR